MITGTWRVTSEIGENIPLVMSDSYYVWFIFETVKSIVYANNDYNNLTVYYDNDMLECSSVTYLDVLVESMMEMYYSTENALSGASQGLSDTGDEIESIPSAVLNQYLGDLHFELFTALSMNNDFTSFQHVVNALGGVHSVQTDANSAVINIFGEVYHYIVRENLMTRLETINQGQLYV